jgi:hypothetical protein
MSHTNNEGSKNAPLRLVESLYDLSRLDSISYCINCTEESTGAIGTFAYDEFLYLQGLGHFSIGPVFADVDHFYAWAKEQGFLYYSKTSAFVMQRKFP